MKGYIFYAAEDAAKNGRFIELCTQAAHRRGAALELVIAERLTWQTQDGTWNCTYHPTPGAPPVTLERPDFAIMRTRDPALSRRIEAAGVRAFNSSSVCAMANDKRRTYAALSGTVPMLPTWHLPRDIAALAPPQDYPLVVKPALGHGGQGVTLVQNPAELHALLASGACPNPIVQPLCSEPGRDLRVYVLGGEVLCAMLRTAQAPQEFRSNFSLGGSASVHQLSASEQALVSRVLSHDRFDLAGIDLIYHNGASVLNEIEDVVGCRMLYEYTSLDVADLYVAHILENI